MDKIKRNIKQQFWGFWFVTMMLVLVFGIILPPLLIVGVAMSIIWVFYILFG